MEKDVFLGTSGIVITESLLWQFAEKYKFKLRVRVLILFV